MTVRYGIPPMDRKKLAERSEQLQRRVIEFENYLDDVEDLDREDLLERAADLQSQVNDLQALVALTGDTDLPIGKVWLEAYRCRCGHEWVSRIKSREPRVCPKCKSPNWNELRRFSRS